jgi:ubiquinone/menaquinone biosynthesis C-methylase UbiE
MNIEKLYQNRFDTAEQIAKNKLWKTLCNSFFSRYVKKEDTVIDIAAGYCEFINNIQCNRKIAIDVNPDTAKYAASDVTVIQAPSSNADTIETASVNEVFISNFFEHISKQDVLTTLNECERMLTEGGKIIILQPNIKYTKGAYWDFFDHHTPLTDKSLCEALEISGFKVIKAYPKFLPYTTKSKIPQFNWLVKMYLHFPLAWKFMGKQALVIAEKR